MTSRHWLSFALLGASLGLVHCAAVDNQSDASGRDGATADGSSDSITPSDTPSTDSSGEDVVGSDTIETDSVTPDVVVDMDVVTPTDTPTPMDVVTPTDTPTPMDIVTPIDVVTPTDTPTPIDVVAPTCSGGRFMCGAVCVDPLSDNLNCGACGHGCSTGEVCAAGTCAMTVRGLVVSELRPATVPYIELYNGTNAPLDLLNYRVQWSTEAGGSGSVTLPTFALPSGAFVTLRSGSTAPAGEIALGSALTWTTDLAVRLLAPSGLGIDFVRTGPSTAAPPVGTTWSGAGAPNPTAATDQVVVRAVYSPDTDSAADWSLQSRSSPGEYCARPGRCGATCVDLDTDRDNCGACGYHCSGSQICRSGTCVAGTGRAWLSEYRLYGIPGVEIHNPSSMPIDLGGYRIQVAPTSGTTLSFFLPTRTLAPGGFLMIYSGTGADDATSVYTGMTTGFGPDVAIGLYDATNTGIDFVRVGAATMAPPVGLSWFGATIVAPSATIDQSIKRDIGAFDTDSAADWSLSSPATPGYLCNEGLTPCSGRCVDRAVDRANCGACGTSCGAQETCEAGTCRSIGGLVLSELAASNQSFELFNGTPATIDLSGYILDWVADGGSASFVMASGTSIPSGGFMRFRGGAGTSTATDIYMGTGVTVNWTSYVAISVRNALNVGVDFVKTGASPTPPPTGTTWTGATATNPNRGTGESLVRNLWATDTNSAADWTIAAAATPLSYCATTSAVMCNTTCTNTANDANNCGACGNTCPSGERCGGGLCAGGPFEGDIRLVGGTMPNQGRVEVYHAGSWGTVCDDGLEAPGTYATNFANVVCRQLGYSSGSGSMGFAAYGMGTGQIWMDNVSCAGSEATLVSCPFNGFGTHNCSHSEDVGVTCL